MRVFLLLLLLLIPTTSHALITTDATSACEYVGGSNQSTLTCSHTVGVGSNTTLVVQSVAYSDSGSASAAASTVTYNGDAMTKAVELDYSSGKIHSSIWYRHAPDTGTHNVVITFAGSGSNYNGSGAVSLFGVDQVTPEATNTAQTNDTGGVISVTTVDDNAWTVSTVATQNVGMTGVAAGQTFNFQKVFNLHGGSYKGPKTPAGSETHTYNNGNNTQNWSMTIASFASADAAPPVVPVGAVLVQNKWAQNNTPPGTGSIPITFDSTPEAGNLVVVGLKIYNAGDGDWAHTLTDNKGNIYTLLNYTEGVKDAGNVSRNYIYYSFNISSSATFTVTSVMSNSHPVLYNAMAIFEVSGAYSSPSPQFVGTTGTSTTPAPGTLTPVGSNSSFYVSYVDSYAAVTAGPGGSWVFTDNADTGATATLIGSGAQTPTFTCSSAFWIASMAVFEGQSIDLGDFFDVF